MEIYAFFVVGSVATPLEFYLPDLECHLSVYQRYQFPFTHSVHRSKFESSLYLSLGHHGGDGYYSDRLGLVIGKSQIAPSYRAEWQAGVGLWQPRIRLIHSLEAMFSAIISSSTSIALSS